MLSFNVVNLLIPGDPKSLRLSLPSGTWALNQNPNFSVSKAAICKGQCAETYILEHPIAMPAGAAAIDTAFEEVTPILLAASYSVGLSVTIRRSTSASDLAIVQATEHWPRERNMGQGSPVITSCSEFIWLVEQFVGNWAQAGQTEKALLLIHHWLDALACWSMEDLYLSATTLLQVIVATEGGRQGKKELAYYEGVTNAANRFSLRTLGDDFKKMRNELVHDGQLIGNRFTGPDKLACAGVVADVLNWFDEYIHRAVLMGNPRKTRFSNTDFIGLNAYSIK